MNITTVEVQIFNTMPVLNLCVFLGKIYLPVKIGTENKWTANNFSAHQEYRELKNTAVFQQ